MERLILPRPPKDLRIVELWGVEEKLLHSPERMGDAIDEVINMMGLHPVSDSAPLEYSFTPHGLSYVRLLEESHIAGHTYFEQNGHLDLQLSTCTAGLDLDSLSLVTRSVFRPKGGGFCYQAGYPQLQIIDKDQIEPVRPLTFSVKTKAWTIAPWRYP